MVAIGTVTWVVTALMTNHCAQGLILPNHHRQSCQTRMSDYYSHQTRQNLHLKNVDASILEVRKKFGEIEKIKIVRLN